MASENSARDRHVVKVGVSDQSQLPSLRDWLLGQQGVEVVQTPGTPGTGEQGALDVLTVLAGSSGLVAAIKVLPEFIRSRRSGFRIEATVRGEKITLDATNVKDMMPILERLLDD